MSPVLPVAWDKGNQREMTTLVDKKQLTYVHNLTTNQAGGDQKSEPATKIISWKSLAVKGLNEVIPDQSHSSTEGCIGYSPPILNFIIISLFSSARLPIWCLLEGRESMEKVWYTCINW